MPGGRVCLPRQTKMIDRKSNLSASYVVVAVVISIMLSVVAAFALEHEHVWVSGRCFSCGESCSHPSWTEGICDVCEYVCPHERHNPDTRICDACGSVAGHQFVKNECIRCFAIPQFREDHLPFDLCDPSDRPGSIEQFEYKAPHYAANYSEKMRHYSVYLPYGYTAERPYNVMVLIHGLNGTPDDWFTRPWHIQHTRLVTGKTLLDNMIANGDIDPIIFVAIEAYPDCGLITQRQLAMEIRNDILPMICERYSTYAKTGNIEDIIAAREHFGIGGASNGSLDTYGTGIYYNLDIFANFMCLSGSGDISYVIDHLNTGFAKEYPISMLFIGAGTQEVQNGLAHKAFNRLMSEAPNLVEGENAYCFVCQGEHEWSVWFTEMYNCMPLMFPVERLHRVDVSNDVKDAVSMLFQ